MPAVRFFLILAVTWTLTGLSAKPQLAATFLPALFIAVIGVAIPLYLLQVGIKHTEPITAAIVPSLSPLVAYMLQLPVGRLKASALTLAGVLAIVILVARHDARNGSSSASQSVGRGGRRPQPGHPNALNLRIAMRCPWSSRALPFPCTASRSARVP